MRFRPTRLLLAALGTVAWTGCVLVLNIEKKEYDPPDSQDGSSTTVDGAPAPAEGGAVEDRLVAADVLVGCPPDTRGGVMVKVPLPSGGFYCIDATEVTRVQYSQFLAETANGTDTKGQPPECISNTTYKPDSYCITGPNTCTSACDAHPQVCVTWCQALMYCKWAGKRLCGKIGGGATPFGPEASDANVSQWMFACSSGGKYAFPYGNTFQEDTCRTKGTVDSTSSVATIDNANCHPVDDALKSVFDMSGNVAEWEDSFKADTSGTGPELDTWLIRGGSFFDSDGGASCGNRIGVTRMRGGQPDVGFRCCAP